MLHDRDLTYLGKEIITPSALPLSGLEPKISSHHKSWKEEEGGVNSPSCSREHKGDEAIGDKLWELPFPSLSEGIIGISNQPSNPLSDSSCLCLLTCPAWPSPCSPSTAFPWQWDTGLLQGTPQLSSLLLLFHVLALAAFAAFPCTSAFAACAGLLPKYGSGSLRGQQSQIWLSLGLVHLLILHWEMEDLGEVCTAYKLLQKRQLPRNPDVLCFFCFVLVDY